MGINQLSYSVQPFQIINFSCSFVPVEVYVNSFKWKPIVVHSRVGGTQPSTVKTLSQTCFQLYNSHPTYSISFLNQIVGKFVPIKPQKQTDCISGWKRIQITVNNPAECHIDCHTTWENKFQEGSKLHRFINRSWSHIFDITQPNISQPAHHGLYFSSITRFSWEELLSVSEKLQYEVCLNYDLYEMNSEAGVKR